VKVDIEDQLQIWKNKKYLGFPPLDWLLPPEQMYQCATDSIEVSEGKRAIFIAIYGPL